MAENLLNLNVFECVGLKALTREIAINEGTKKSIGIFGDAGVGKTDAVHQVAEEQGFHKMFEVRMAGMSAEDMIGLPIKTVSPTTGETVVKFAKLNWMQYIQDNKDKRILLFLDELNRADPEILPALFNLLECKIDGEFFPNLTIVAAMNYGQEYDSNIEFSDPALKRRMNFIKYTPEKKDAIEFIKKMQYQKDLIKVCEHRDIQLISTEIDGSANEILEQQTTYGSFYSFNARLKNLARFKKLNEKIGQFQHNGTLITEEEYKVLKLELDKNIQKQLEAKLKTLEKEGQNEITIKFELGKLKALLLKDEEGLVKITEDNYHNLLKTKDVVTELKTYGMQYFNKVMLTKLVQKMQDLLQLKNLDVIKEVIKKGYIEEEYKMFEEDLLLRCKNEITSDPTLFKKYPKEIVKLFDSKFEYIISAYSSIIDGTKSNKYINLTSIKASNKSKAVYDIINEFLNCLDQKYLTEFIDILDQSVDGTEGNDSF